MCAAAWTLSGMAQDWQQEPFGRSASLPAPVGIGRVGFTRLHAPDTGIGFTNRIDRSRYLTNQIPLNGSGVAAGDVDGDGRVDAFFAGLNGTSVLFQNRGGWRFTATTSTAFPSPTVFRQGGVDATGCAFADLDGDGDLDLVVNTVGRGTGLYFNDGHGVFTQRTLLNTDRCGASLALADLDGDGDLDLYITNYRTQTVRDDPSATWRITQDEGRPRVAFYNGRSTSEPDLVGRFYVTGSGVKENGEPDVLYRNDGSGNFEAVSWSSGAFVDEDGQALVAPPYDWGLSVMARDFTGDGRPDIYVCNDFESPDRFWINETVPGGHLRFRAASFLAVRTTSAFSMGVDVADVNRDGVWDFFTADMRSRTHALRAVQIQNLPPNVSRMGVYADRAQFSHNTLQLGRGDGTFMEIGRLSGLSASEWSWTPAFLDVDLDGFDDLIISNGHEMDMMDADASMEADRLKSQKKLSRQEMLELRGLFRRGNSPNAAFRNATADASNAVHAPRFVDVSAAWGLADPEVSNGLCLADLDGDGDLDVLMNNLNGAAGIYRNDAAKPRIALRLKGSGRNTGGIGAVVRLHPGTSSAPPTTRWSAPMQEWVAGGRYLSSDDGQHVFAAEPAGESPGSPRQLQITWRSGRTTVVSNVVAGRLYEIVEAPEVTASPVADTATKAPWFEDLTDALKHRHVEAPFNDRERQALLPRFLSTLGPGVSWLDVDEDGRDELVIGTGRSGRLAVFHNESKPGQVRLRPMTNAVLSKPAGRDQTTTLLHNGVLISGSSNYEDGTTNGGLVRLVSLAAGKSGDSILGNDFSAGPLALADVDGDSTLELFIGGRTRPGQYPAPAPSALYRFREGRYTPAQRVDALGMVSGAVFSDVDGDGDPDLILACEWGPVRVLRNDKGRLVDQTAALGLDRYSGWWNSVAAGDFDEDGRMDFVAGNWGWNEFLNGGAPLSTTGDSSASPPSQRTLFYGDFEGRGIQEIIEGWLEGESGAMRPVRQFPSLAATFPALPARYPTLMSFGKAALPEVLTACEAGSTAKPAQLNARWFASSVFLNRGDHFDVAPLPFEAQASPVYGLAVADLDGDGHQDLFAAQNFHMTHPEDARQDAGRGVLLLGDGRGGFRSISGQQSGLALWGEGRGAAVCDIDGDGRVDLVAGQNGAETRLFWNHQAQPGLRVRFEGTEGNSTAIGASVRWADGSKRGPWFERHAGSGYWSNDGAVVVVPRAGSIPEIEVRWPGGALKRYTVPPQVPEMTVRP